LLEDVDELPNFFLLIPSAYLHTLLDDEVRDLFLFDYNIHIEQERAWLDFVENNPSQ